MKATWLETGRPIDAAQLAEQGIFSAVISPDPVHYREPLERFARERGYVTEDVVDLTPTTPNLEGLLDKFKGEHRHTDDEVRFVLEGEGTFDIRSRDDQWMRVDVGAGDLIVVPADRHHRFFLSEKKRIRCVRLYCDPSGWVAHYR